MKPGRQVNCQVKNLRLDSLLSSSMVFFFSTIWCSPSELLYHFLLVDCSCSCRCCIPLSAVKIKISATTWYSETDMRWHSSLLKYLTQRARVLEIQAWGSRVLRVTVDIYWLQILKYLIFVTFLSIPHTCCLMTYSFYIEKFYPSFDEYFLVLLVQQHYK